jgi:hypothetical protein
MNLTVKGKVKAGNNWSRPESKEDKSEHAQSRAKLIGGGMNVGVAAVVAEAATAKHEIPMRKIT